MKYIRMYADENGDSHFEEAEVEMSQTESNLELSTSIVSTNIGFRRFPVAWQTPPMPAPRRMFVFLLAGEVELTVSDGAVRRIGPGSVVLTEDTWGKGHAARVVGEERSLQAVVQLPE